MANILVVDQDAGSREFIREILSDFGYCVFVAGSVADAAGLWADNAIDLALLDTRTVEHANSVSSRGSALRSLRAPVIALSGASASGAWNVPIQGVVALLEKPVRLQPLLNTVHRLLAIPQNADAGSSDVAALTPRASAPRLGNALALFELPLRAARAAFERLYLEHQLIAAGGHVAGLAKRTGLERTHLHRKLRQVGLRGRDTG